MAPRHTIQPSQKRCDRGAISKGLIAAIAIIAVGFGLSVGALWLGNSLQEKTFTGPHKVQPTSNPNHHYAVEMQAVHLGSAGENFIIRADVRLVNRGGVPVNLDATAVRLVDAKDNQYAPTFPPDTRTGIVLTPQQSESLTFEFLAVPRGALDGELCLLFHQRRVRIKNSVPLQAKLRDGEFRVLRQIGW